MISAISLMLAAAHDLRSSWRPLARSGLLYRLVAFALLTPVVGATLKAFMWLAGDEVLADQDIALFLLSPLGIATLLLVGAASLAVVALEQACLMAVCAGPIDGLPVAARPALIFALRRFPAIAHVAVRVLLRTLLLALPFLAAVGVTYLVLLTRHDVNYYLALRPPEFTFALGIAAAVLGIGAIVVARRLLGWSLALPLVLFGEVLPAEALTRSEGHVTASRTTVAALLVGWAVAATVLAALPLALVGGPARLIVPRLAGSTTLLIAGMGFALLILVTLNLLASIAGAALLAALTMRLYETLVDAPPRLPLELLAERPVGVWLRLTPRRVVTGVTIVVALGALAGHLFVDGIRVDDDVLVIAHRGAGGEAPENTLAAVALALEQGADMVEVDVQESADGVVVVSHDSDLMRVGEDPIRIWEGTAERLRSVDIGAWFGAEFTGQRVPTLAEVLDLCRDRARVTIELKYYGHDQRLEERVAEIVERAGMADQVVLMSLKYAAVQKMKALRPDWTVGLLTARAVGDLTRTSADFLAVNRALATPSFIRHAHAAGKDVYVWTVNDAVNMSRFISRGVDGVITDYPNRAREVLAARADMSVAERFLLAAAFWAGLEPREPPVSTDVPADQS